MSRANQPTTAIRCPECETSVSATVPPGSGLAGDDADRLQGNNTSCGNCGHELELYYY